MGLATAAGATCPSGDTRQRPGWGMEAALTDIEEDQVPLVVMGSEWTKAVATNQPHMLSFIQSLSQSFIHPNIYSFIQTLL